jgi:hypothetical protein
VVNWLLGRRSGMAAAENRYANGDINDPPDAVTRDDPVAVPVTNRRHRADIAFPGRLGSVARLNTVPRR